MARKAKSAPFDAAVFLATVNHGRSMSEHRAGRVIYAQGEAADSVFHIVRGKVKIFGEGCLIGQPLRLAAATAMADVTVPRIEKAEMIRVLHAQPAFAECSRGAC
jgi:CRP/FNR family transcriptional regulator, cyclic AMP receptor protein